MATMISKNGVLAVHPGWYIKEYLRYNAIPTSEFAKDLGVSEDVVNKLINGNVELSDDLIAKLSNAIGTAQTLWRNSNNQYLDHLQKMN